MACAMCRKCVAGRQDARRRIDSQSTAHVKSILSEVANRFHSGIVQTLFGDHSLVCRLCFQTAEKLAKLKEEVTAKEAELKRMKISVEEAVASLSVLSHVNPASQKPLLMQGPRDPGQPRQKTPHRHRRSLHPRGHVRVSHVHQEGFQDC